jgi:hypothetical protein
MRRPGRYDEDDPLRSPEAGFQLLEAERRGLVSARREAPEAKSVGLFMLFLLALDLVALLIALWIFGPIGAAIVVAATIIAYAIRSRG